MPDTGPPWNIPYVEPTDTVRTYPQDSEDLADAIAAGLSAAGNAGIGTNVVQTVKTDVFTASVGQGVFTAITGMEATITPTTDTSKILVMATVTLSAPNHGVNLRLMRNSSVSTYIGDALSSASRATSGAGNPEQSHSAPTVTVMFLDSPATDAATTYSIEASHSNTVATTISVNRASTATSSRDSVFASSITLIEVAV
jgi:hypothetical protein